MLRNIHEMFKLFVCCLAPCVNEEARQHMREAFALEIASEKPKREVKLLVLGMENSGKSTLIKQMRLIHGDGYTLCEQKSFIKYIYQNVLTSIQKLIKAMKQVRFPVKGSIASRYLQVATDHVIIQLEIDYEHPQYRDEANRLLTVDISLVG